MFLSIRYIQFFIISFLSFIPFIKGGKVARILGGEYANFSEWTFIVALYVPQNFTANENQTENHKVFENHCQGVIINKWQILTAAHCILGDEDRIRIVSGTSIIFRHLPTDLPYRKPINSKIFPLYVAGDLINDIGIITVNKCYDFVKNKLIRSIQLEAPNQAPQVGDVCSVAGWGNVFDDPDFAGYPKVLRSTTLTVSPLDECQRLYLDYLGWTFPTVLNSSTNILHICAGDLGKDSEIGDSGGPLVCKGKQSGQPFLAGLVAFGLPPGSMQIPGVYTHILPYKRWIEYNLVENSEVLPEIPWKVKETSLRSGSSIFTKDMTLIMFSIPHVKMCF